MATDQLPRSYQPRRRAGTAGFVSLVAALFIFVLTGNAIAKPKPQGGAGASAGAAAGGGSEGPSGSVSGGGGVKSVYRKNTKPGKN
jgi:hypothetical protein